MKNRKIFLTSAAIAMLMAFGIHRSQEFRFYNLESVNLFLYDWKHIWSVLGSHGGFAMLVSSFLTQFMRIPFTGACIATMLYMLTGWMTGRIMTRFKGGEALAGLSLLPAAFLFLCLENDYYMFHGHVAFAISVAAVLICDSLPIRNLALRCIADAIAAFLLYFLVGSAAIVFAVSIFVLEMLRYGFRGVWAMTCPAVLLLSAFISVRFSIASGWDTALTPFMYYSNPSTYFFPAYAWAMLPLLIVASRIASYAKFRPSHILVASAAGVILSFFIAWNLYGKVHSRSNYRMLQEQYLAETGQWDEIINSADRRQPTFFVSYLNLALAQKDMLMRNFMYFNPQTLSSLMYPVPNLKDGFTLQSAVYEAWGYHAAARQAAFDANLVTPGMCNPRQLQVLVRTNMALGADDVARKYLSLLGKTLFYRKWAESKVDGLGEPSAVLPHVDEYVRYDGMKGDMRDILDSDPSQRILAQFYELYQLLEKEEKI